MGFDSLGSVPSLIALRIRAAFHLENTIFFCISSSMGSHILRSWKNVAAASKVSAVCLRNKHCQPKPLSNPLSLSIPRHLVRPEHTLSPFKCLLRKLLDVGAACCIVRNSIVVGVFCFYLCQESAC